MNLFDEVSFGGVTLKNRIAVAPMGVVHDMDGGVSQQQADYLIERAKGGFGLIYPAAMTVTDKWESPVYSGATLTSVSHMLRLKNMVDEIHRYGAKVAIQITPGYGRVHAGPPGVTNHVSASDNTVFAYPDHKCHALTVDEIKEIHAGYNCGCRICGCGGRGYHRDPFLWRISYRSVLLKDVESAHR